MEAMKNLEKRVKRYLPVELDVDTSYLNNTQVHLARQLIQKVCLFVWPHFSFQEQVLESLINAAAFMDDIFETQVGFSHVSCHAQDSEQNINKQPGVEGF